MPSPQHLSLSRLSTQQGHKLTYRAWRFPGEETEQPCAFYVLAAASVAAGSSGWVARPTMGVCVYPVSFATLLLSTASLILKKALE